MTRLTAVQHRVIQDRIEHGGFTLKQMSLSAGCSIHAVARKRNNISVFGASGSPTQRAGPPSSITPAMRHALCEFLSKRSDRYLEEMRAYLHATFGVLVSISITSIVVTCDRHAFLFVLTEASLPFPSSSRLQVAAGLLDSSI